MSISDPPTEMTRLPVSLDEEDPFLNWDFIQLSLRQLLTIIGSLMVTVILIKMLTSVLPFSSLLVGLMFSWIPLGGLFLSLKKKNDRPYEEYLSHKLVFMMHPDRYTILKDPKSEYGDVLDVDWEEIHDDTLAFH